MPSVTMRARQRGDSAGRHPLREHARVPLCFRCRTHSRYTPAPERAYRMPTRRHAADPYRAPARIETTTLEALLAGTGRAARHGALPSRQEGLFAEPARSTEASGLDVDYAGDSTLLNYPCAAVVGTRNVSPEGAARARRIAADLVAAGIVVVSGLAKGVDTVALTAAIEAGGRVVGVLGTPLDRATPTENGPLQERMCREHLVISQFPVGTPTLKSHFPQRNRTMATISDGTIIVEASNTSGTLHQAAECTRLGRWLFILKSVTETTGVTWPANFLRYPTTVVVSRSADVIDRILASGRR